MEPADNIYIRQMKLYYNKSDNRVGRIIALLEVMGIDCALVPITEQDLTTMAELRALSPLGLTPILQADEVILYTLGSILKFLAKHKREKGYAGLLLKEEVQVSLNNFQD